MTNREEIERRRTFAIISHPDAGKTTLTEKLLLYGGAINQAGSVKGKQSAKHAVSDWMDIEKQRGISVTSSVLQFNYAGKCVNILDTPGHQDFSEDTYRTLMAADSAVMVIDAAKGVEAQTIKLFKVCTLRHIPIFTFINKMDREARDPFELMENIEEILGIKTYPMNWPIGCGKEFKGVFDRNTRKVLAFSSDGRANGVKKVDETEAELGDPALDELLTPYLHQQLVDEIELLDGAAEEFDLDKVLRGELSPVFFGSALTNFGVEPFLENFLRLTPTPLARVDSLTGETVDPCRDEFSAFIFKIQANMNKAHRDRIAFMRICSGKFERGMEAFHVQEKAAALEGCLKDGEDQDRHLLDMPFSAFGMLAAEDIAKFQAKYGYLGLQFLPYHVTGCDILRAGQDKATGLQALLDHLGLAAADCVAVGDGPNDAGMLALAGRSYCMADGMKTAKAAAKALAPAAAPDGIAQLCRSLWPEIFR